MHISLIEKCVVLVATWPFAESATLLRQQIEVLFVQPVFNLTQVHYAECAPSELRFTRV